MLAIGLTWSCAKSGAPNDGRSSPASSAPTATAPAEAASAEPRDAVGGSPAFHVDGGAGHGWVRLGPGEAGAALMKLSGPPGGPLGFEVHSYAEAPIEDLFRRAVPSAASQPITAGSPEKVRVAGADRDAQAFRVGRSMATSNWCAIKVPSGARAGLLLLAQVGTNEKTAPTCSLSTGAAPIRPLIDSFTVE